MSVVTFCVITAEPVNSMIYFIRWRPSIIYQGLSEKALKPEIGHVLFSISKLICYAEQKASLKQAPGILFCDTFILLTHQKRQCVTQDLISAVDEGIESFWTFCYLQTFTFPKQLEMCQCVWFKEMWFISNWQDLVCPSWSDPILNEQYACSALFCWVSK